MDRKKLSDRTATDKGIAMSAKDRSFGQRLRRVKDPARRFELVQDWAEGWIADQSAIIHRLQLAEEHRDMVAFSGNLAQLIAGPQKYLLALPGILRTIAEGADGSGDEG